jgi:hypothetical protein
VRYARGHAEVPLTQNDLKEKFLACLEYGGAASGSEALFDRLMSMETHGARTLLVGGQPPEAPRVENA